MLLRISVSHHSAASSPNFVTIDLLLSQNSVATTMSDSLAASPYWTRLKSTVSYTYVLKVLIGTPSDRVWIELISATCGRKNRMTRLPERLGSSAFLANCSNRRMLTACSRNFFEK